MKALTVWQPWASLIMAGAKPWEWRGWRAPRALVGQRIVIHAGVRRPSRDEILDILDLIADGDCSLIGTTAKPLLERADVGHMLLGCGLGTAILGEPISADAWARQQMGAGYDSDRIDHHQWAWPLTDIRPFGAPVPMRGAQGFWNWPEVVDG